MSDKTSEPLEHTLLTCSFFACHMPGSPCPFVANPEYRPEPPVSEGLDEGLLEILDRYDTPGFHHAKAYDDIMAWHNANQPKPQPVSGDMEEAKPTATDTKNFRKLTNEYRPTLRHWATNLPDDEFDKILTEYGAKAFALGFRDINKLLKEQQAKLEQDYLTQFKERAVAVVEALVKHDVEEVDKLNKALDSRSQQSAHDTAVGYIKANAEAAEAIRGIEL